jgi:hypothetical protein
MLLFHLFAFYSFTPVNAPDSAPTITDLQPLTRHFTKLNIIYEENKDLGYWDDFDHFRRCYPVRFWNTIPQNKVIYVCGSEGSYPLKDSINICNYFCAHKKATRLELLRACKHPRFVIVIVIMISNIFQLENKTN